MDNYVESAQYLANFVDKVDNILPSHNIPWTSSAYLQKMAVAFQDLKAGKVDFIETDGVKEYTFDGFSIITK